MLLETVASVLAAGRSAHVFIPTDGPLVAQIIETGASVTLLPTPVLRKSLMTPRAAFVALAQMALAIPRIVIALRHSGAELLWANTLTQPHWFIAARLCRLKLVVHVRESEDEASVFLQRLLTMPLLLSHLIVANSEHTRDFIKRNIPLKNDDTLRVVHNGKDWARYFRSEPRKVSGALKILLVGRLSPRKGQDILIRGLQRLQERGIPFRARFVGDVFPGYEWYRESLIASALELGVHPHCEFEGFSEEVATHLQWADIVVVPSRVEPFGTVAAEGQGAMRPVIVSDVGGLVEIVRHENSGLVFPNGSDEGLFDRIVTLFENPTMSLRLAKQGYHDVHSRFSRDRYRQEIISTLNSLSRDAPNDR